MIPPTYKPFRLASAKSTYLISSLKNKKPIFSHNPRARIASTKSSKPNPCLFSSSWPDIKMIGKPILMPSPGHDISSQSKHNLVATSIDFREREKRTYFINGFNQIPRQPIWINGENNFSDLVQEQIRSYNRVSHVDLYTWAGFIITSGEISVHLHWPRYPNKNWRKQISSPN